MLYLILSSVCCLALLSDDDDDDDAASGGAAANDLEPIGFLFRDKRKTVEEKGRKKFQFQLCRP